MDNYIRFGFTALNGTNKAGTLTADENGYYTVVLGGLDVYNSANQFYPYEPAKALFTNSSQLMRRVSNGALRGEYGHPKMQVNQSLDSFAQRILAIYEENVSHHISEVTLDFDRLKDAQGRKCIAIVGKVLPCGPNGAVLKASIENKRENVCFSIRSFTRDEEVGRTTNRILKNIVTWDYVNEPGISIANKFQSPALEEFSETMFTKKNFERGLKATSGMGLESVRLNTEELFQSLGWGDEKVAGKPAYLNW
jgi:hypothetical protein